MPERWQVIFEVTLDIKDGSESQSAALEKAKKALDKLTDTEIAHYHVLQHPKIVFEFD